MPRSSPETGASMVEFALVLPLLILLVFGIIEFSRAYNVKVTLTHAAREGVRVWALEQDAAKAELAAEGAAPLLDSALLDVSTTDCTPGSPTSLSVSYPWDIEVPLFGSFSLVLLEEGVMRCSG